MRTQKTCPQHPYASKIATVAFLTCMTLALLTLGAQAQVPIEQQPLTLSNNVPGNVVLTPSVEWPTVMSMSNLGGFEPGRIYGGYFDPEKCYTYNPSGDIPTTTPAPMMAHPKGEIGYFEPASVSASSPAKCSGQWSGNYLNWAATQTIDTFRSVMTGGYRVVDTSTRTVLEKARHTGQTGTGDRKISNKNTVSDQTPSTFKYFVTRLKGLGNKMYFVSADNDDVMVCNGDVVSEGDEDDYDDDECRERSLRYLLNNAGKYDVVAYTGNAVEAGRVYSVNVDVLVCDASMPETNCIDYGAHYKPEGLIQKYAKTFKYSVFGYLNVSNYYQDGAALRAKQKFVGPYTYDPVLGKNANPAKEWDPETGILIKNPDAAAASATSGALGVTISDSGVINYINKFGQMTATGDKSFDPVSEMYYAAIRYLKNQSPVAAYSKNTTSANVDAYKMADGFPIVTTAGDPMVYACQKNFILGIGDANTHRDKNLPGNTNGYQEPSMPSEVAGDNTVDVVEAVTRIGIIEGINTLGNAPFTGRQNSAYIAGLAYDSHTQDMRPNMTGMQTVSTYWVDVEENQVLEPTESNQYLLATKYGGFTMPQGYDPYQRTEPLPKSWWSTTGDILTTSGINEPRPDNFFEGGDAAAMRSGLSQAFSAIASANAGSKTSLSLNVTKLQANSTVYLASYVEGAWSGALKAFSIDPDTKIVSTIPLWSASVPNAASRDVYALVGGVYEAFNDTNVSGNGWTDDVVNYMRGDRSKEVKNGGSLRNRTTVIGDIVHSQPVYVGAPGATLFLGASFTGASDYAAFATNNANRSPVLYVASNDGMLHGFDAETGVETYAFMPGAVLSASENPSVTAEQNYGSGINPHRYFNDGKLTVADVYYSNAWHTVLVGTTGRSVAKAIYALDITDPDDVKFLWEISAADNAYIGQITGKPIVAHTANGWFVLVGNGYNSSNGTAALLSIALDGSDPSATVYTTNIETDNGLATPGVWIGDTSNYLATKAYAGDLDGNLWVFDLSSTSGAATKVFTTQANQPITAPIALGTDASTGHLWAFFGTGKYLSTADLSDDSMQSWYGIIVDGSLPVTQSDLLQRSIAAQTTGAPADPNASPPTTAVEPARAFSTGSDGDMSGKLGWYLNLVPPSGSATGERMLVGNQFVNGYLIGASLIPDTSNPCAIGGKGWVMALDPFSGTNPENVYFDLNHDGEFNDKDKVQVGDSKVAAGGMQFISLTGQPSFTGALMLNNLNGKISKTNLNPAAGPAARVSWREVVR